MLVELDCGKLFFTGTRTWGLRKVTPGDGLDIFVDRFHVLYPVFKEFVLDTTFANGIGCVKYAVLDRELIYYGTGWLSAYSRRGKTRFRAVRVYSRYVRGQLRLHRIALNGSREQTVAIRYRSRANLDIDRYGRSYALNLHVNTRRLPFQRNSN